MQSHLTTFSLAILSAAVAADAAPQQQDVVPPGGFVAAYATGMTSGAGVKAGENQDSIFNNDLDFQMFTGSGSTTDSANFSQGQTTNAAQGNVSLGVIQMSGSNSAPNTSFFPAGAVNGGWSDLFTINAPGQTGQNGLLLAALNVHGTLFAQGFAGAAAVHVTGYKDKVGLPTRPEFDRGNSDPIAAEGSLRSGACLRISRPFRERSTIR